MEALEKKCHEAFEQILEPDSSGEPTKLNSLTVTDFAFNIAEVAGVDFLALHEKLIQTEIHSFQDFWSFFLANFSQACTKEQQNR